MQRLPDSLLDEASLPAVLQGRDLIVSRWIGGACAPALLVLGKSDPIDAFRKLFAQSWAPGRDCINMGAAWLAVTFSLVTSPEG